MASEYTPNLNLDLYTNSDKPNLRDQYNAAMRKIDTAYSAAIGSDRIADGAVKTTKIADLAVTSGKIADAAVIADKLGAGSVTESKIANGAVTAAKIATGAVESGNIANGAITNQLLASDFQVDSSQIANGAVTKEKLGSDVSFTPEDNSIATKMIQDGAVTDTKIADSALTLNAYNRNSTFFPDDFTFGDRRFVLAENFSGSAPTLVYSPFFMAVTFLTGIRTEIARGTGVKYTIATVSVAETKNPAHMGDAPQFYPVMAARQGYAESIKGHIGLDFTNNSISVYIKTTDALSEKEYIYCPTIVWPKGYIMYRI